MTRPLHPKQQYTPSFEQRRTIAQKQSNAFLDLVRHAINSTYREPLLKPRPKK